MRRVLLCSPYYPEKEQTTCGLANWTRNILSKQRDNNDVELKLIPFDRSVDLNEESSLLLRVYSGIKDYPALIHKAKIELQSNKYDILQVSSNGSIGMIKDFFMARYAKKYGAKMLIHHHFGRIPELINSSGWEGRLLRLNLKVSLGSIVMDRASYNALKESGYENVYYLPNPLSEKWFNQIENERGRIERDANTILFVGHVVKTKGIHELVEACDSIPGIKVKVVGKVTESAIEELRALCKKRSNTDWLHFVGEITHEEVLREMARCSIFVLPTYTEGFPNVILESMACYCPIVTTSVGAIPEMLDVDNNPCGIVVPPQNAIAIKNGIEQILSNKVLGDELGLRAGKRVREMYTTDKVWNKLLSLWNQL
jgi:glycosyltransferase involved in cell wall biosynthesis